MLNADYYNNKDENHSRNDFEFVLLFENGNEIICINKEIISPLTNFELIKYNYAIYFEEKGYDI